MKEVSDIGGSRVHRGPYEATRQLAKESPELGHAFTELLGEQTRQSVDTFSAFARAVNWTDVAQAQSKLIAGSFLRFSQFNARYGQFLLRGMTAAAASPPGAGRCREAHLVTMPLDFEVIVGALVAQRYVFAKTMPQWPHWYCLRREWVGVVDFEPVVQFMRDYGYDEDFLGKKTRRFNVGEFKYWTMGEPLSATVLINRALIREPAGAPSTRACDDERRTAGCKGSRGGMRWCFPANQPG